MSRDARLRSLFLELCDLPAGHQIAAARARCADAPDLLKPLLQMLAADQQTDTGLGIGRARELLADELVVAEAQAVPEQIGQYRVTRVVGSGGMGMVLEAEQEHPRRTVALKLPRLHLNSAEHVERFRLEAQALAELRHPSVPTVYEAGVHEGRAFLAMEYVSGRPLHVAAADLPLRIRVRLLRQLASGVAHAHARDIVHRDLKPSNVLVDEDGAVHVVDFGLACARDGDDHGGGTPRYMAPELSRAGQADPRADVYALGRVLWEILSGEVAGEGRLPALPSQCGDLSWIVWRSTAADPAARYADAGGLLDDLDRWSADRPVSARPWRPGYALGKWLRRNRGWVRAGALATLAGLVAWAATALHRWSAEEQAERLADTRLAVMDRQVQTLHQRGLSDEAEAVFSAFVSLPEHQGTRALSRAWYRHAERAGLGTDEGLHALSNALSAAPDPETHVTVLQRLAAHLRARWAWPSLQAALDRLDAVGAQSPQTRTLARDSALMRADLRRAAELESDPEWAALLGRMAQANPTNHLAWAAYQSPAGPVTVIDQHREHLAITAPAPGLPVVASVPQEASQYTGFGWPAPRFAGATGPAIVLGWRAGNLEIQRLDLTRGRVEPWVRTPLARPLSAAWRACDGTWTLHVGTGPPRRNLYSLDLPDLRRRLTHPPSATLDSDVDALHAADLDGDGCEELVVARGPWTAYEVTVLTRGEDGLREAGGARLGVVPALTVLPDGRIVAARHLRYPNTLAWADPEQQGAADGLHLLRWDGARLHRLQHVPPPSLPAGWQRWHFAKLLAADLDGDGRSELVAELFSEDLGQHLWLLRETDRGEFEGRVVGGVVPLGVAQLDDDPAHELIVRQTSDDQNWVLGAGTARLPERPAPRIQDRVPAWRPDTGEVALDRAARRVDDLVELGLPAEAARQLSTLGALAASPSARQQLQLRSATLHAAADQHREALAQHQGLVGQVPSTKRPEVLRAMLGSQLQLHLYLDAAITASEIGDVDTVADITPLVATPAYAVDLGELSGWRLLAPHQLRRGTDHALEFNLFSGRQDIAVREVRLAGNWVEFSVDLEIDRMELAASVGLLLRSATGQPLLGCRVQITGGGDRYAQALVCVDGRRREHWMSQPAPAPDQLRTVSVRGAYRVDTGEVLFEGTVDGERRAIRPQGLSVDFPQPDRHLELAIVSAGRQGWVGPARVSGRITRLVLEGVEPVPTGSGVAPGTHELVQGQPSRALAALRGVSDPHPTHLVHALTLTGRLAEAAAVLRSAPDEEGVLELLRLHPEIALVGTPDDASLRRLLHAWQGVLRHRELPDVQALLQAPALAMLPGNTPHERAFMYAQAELFLERRTPSRAAAVVRRLLQGEPEDAAALLLGARAFIHESPEDARRAAQRFATQTGSPRAARARLERYGVGHLLPAL